MASRQLKADSAHAGGPSLRCMDKPQISTGLRLCGFCLWICFGWRAEESCGAAAAGSADDGTACPRSVRLLWMALSWVYRACFSHLPVYGSSMRVHSIGVVLSCSGQSCTDIDRSAWASWQRCGQPAGSPAPALVLIWGLRIRAMKSISKHPVSPRFSCVSWRYRVDPGDITAMERENGIKSTTLLIVFI